MTSRDPVTHRDPWRDPSTRDPVTPPLQGGSRGEHTSTCKVGDPSHPVVGVVDVALILDLDRDLSHHLGVALMHYRHRKQAQLQRVPDALKRLERLCISRAIEGQAGTALADLQELSKSLDVAPVLLTYETAATRLSVSVRTLKRLMADPSCPLAAVPVGGTARIRVADLDSFVDGLTVKTGHAA